ncbi:MAG: membrane protein insertion efficiency factor YidD [Anaerolineales bacterium]|nr:membrane protein insertion efficiency factor YidD [Anaerolineales bacterium]
MSSTLPTNNALDSAPAEEHTLEHTHPLVGRPAPGPLPEWKPDFRPSQLPRTLLLALIRLYQLTLSRALPINTCRFYPTCSRYGFEAIQKYGALKGGWLAFWRVMRCHPLNPGGYDPVP